MYSKNWNCVYEKEQKKRVIPINGLCAYCMGKIAPKYGSMKIEHYKALSENKELALEYQNYLGVCYGGKRMLEQNHIFYVVMLPGKNRN